MESGVWKNCRIVFFLFTLLVMFGAGGQIQPSADVFAAPKNNVSYTVKNGTLTVYGKGEVPYIEVPDEKKITKIVVEKGITSIPTYAFWDLKMVKEIIIADSVQKIGQWALPASKVIEKVTMPGSFQIMIEDDEGWPDIQDWSGGYIETVCFNTPLSLKILEYFRSNNLIVSEDDEKYTSVDGVIYSKDRKSIVRVPARRKSLTLIPECEEFCTQSVMYAFRDDEGEYNVLCDRLKKIVLPETVKRIESRKYFVDGWEVNDETTEITIQTDQFDSESISELFRVFPKVERETILRQLAYVSESDGMFINDRDSCLLLYNGAEEAFTVPDDVKKIGKMAFYGNEEIKKVVIPETVREIGNMAFGECSGLSEVIIQSACPFQPLLFQRCKNLMADVKVPEIKLGRGMFEKCQSLEKVVLPEGVTVIPDYTFYYCNDLTEVSLPATVTTIGASAFYDTKVPNTILKQGAIKEIKSYAFQDVGWGMFTIPATVNKIEASAFYGCDGARVTVCGSMKDMDPHAFDTDVVLMYLGDVSQWQTGIYIPEIRIDEEDDVTNPYSEIEFRWQEVRGCDGYEIQVCSEPSFTKKVKTFRAKKEKTKMELSDPGIKMKYVRIRPFQDTGGTRKYGRWCTDKVKVVIY